MSEEDANLPDKIIEALDTYATGIINETLERHKFNNRFQRSGECFDDFLTSLKVLSKTCNFCENCHDSLIRDRVVAGIRNDDVRRKLLAENKLTLKHVEDICRSNPRKELNAQEPMGPYGAHLV